MNPPHRAAPTGVTLLLVSGSGRSGTSSLAGSLKRLGGHVPQPEVQASATNPRGFYEPRWVIDFHKSHLAEVGVTNIDTRPEAVDLVADLLATGGAHEQLRSWLTGQLDHPWLVVKDPHAFWFADVWREVCAELGVTLKWLTSVRHPAEVVGSRDLAYRQGQADAVRRAKEVSNVAGWVHAALLTDKVGRAAGEGGRAFVRYADLLEDWRTALGRVGAQLALTFDGELSSPHPVDDFLEPSMRRSELTWDDLATPAWLQEMAQEVWDLLNRLVDAPDDADVQQRLDEIHADYEARYAQALALTFDHTAAVRMDAVARTRARLGRRVEGLRTTVARLRADLRVARGREGSPRALPGWVRRKARAWRS